MPIIEEDKNYEETCSKSYIDEIIEKYFEIYGDKGELELLWKL